MSKNIIVIGQIDHGKTELINCVNSIVKGEYAEDDRFDKEFNEARYAIKGVSYRLFDIAMNYKYSEGITGSEDFAVLVCSAVDGPMPDTKRHLEICKEKGIKKIAVLLTKTDLCDDEMLLDIIEESVLDVVEECGYSRNCLCTKASPYKAGKCNDEAEKKKITKFLVDIANQI